MCRQCDREDDVNEREKDWGGREAQITLAQSMLAQALRASEYYFKVGNLERAFEASRKVNKLEEYLDALNLENE